MQSAVDVKLNTTVLISQGQTGHGGLANALPLSSLIRSPEHAFRPTMPAVFKVHTYFVHRVTRMHMNDGMTIEIDAGHNLRVRDSK